MPSLRTFAETLFLIGIFGIFWEAVIHQGIFNEMLKPAWEWFVARRLDRACKHEYEKVCDAEFVFKNVCKHCRNEEVEFTRTGKVVANG